MRRAPFFMMIVVAAMTVAWPGRALAAFTPPDDVAADRALLDALRSELTQQHFGDAAARIDGLLADHGGELIATGEGSIKSVAVLVSALAAQNHDKLAAEFLARTEPAAHAALQSLRRSGTCDALTCYALARRYPLTPTAAAALALAGDQSVLVGDLPGAAEFYRLATVAGWTPDEKQSRRMAWLHDAVDGVAIASGGKESDTTDYNGPLPFDAPWYGTSITIADHSYPYGSGGAVYFQTYRRLLTFKGGGVQQWIDALQDGTRPPQKPGEPRPQPQIVPVQPHNKHLNVPEGLRLRQPANLIAIYQPVAISAGGAAQVLVVRVTAVDRATSSLRGIRASDGRELWNSTDEPALRQLIFQPGIVASGRFVYCLAQDVANQQGTLLMIALDSGSGHEIWRVPIGTPSAGLLIEKGGRHTRIAESVALSEMTSVGVVNDAVIATPGVGYAIAVDRFTGQLRWIVPYRVAPDPAAAPDASALPVQSRRFESRPVGENEIVAIAPTDSALAIGLDLRDGRIIWTNHDMADQTLLGGGHGLAIFGGSNLAALDLKDGSSKWTYAPAAGSITGPSVVSGGFVLVPTTALPTVTLAIDSGRLSKPPWKIPSVRGILANESVRVALQADDSLADFGIPRPAPQPPQAH